MFSPSSSKTVILSLVETVPELAAQLQTGRVQESNNRAAPNDTHRLIPFVARTFDCEYSILRSGYCRVRHLL